MNRTLIGLAVGAGYVLGRTKKLKLAMAAGTLIAGRRLKPSPGAVVNLVSRQLKDNPQFKQIGDELRQDLSGVGKAASGALVERQMNALADRLHGRTADVRDQLAGAAGTGHDEGENEDEETSGESTGRKAPTKKSASRTATKTARKAARRAPVRKSAAKKTAGARKTAARTPSRASEGKGGGER